MTVQEFLEQAKAKIETGGCMAALTDEYLVENWPIQEALLTGKEEKLLELRIFGKQGELRLSRSIIGQAFSFRSIFDEGVEKDERDHYDELQYLDIDETAGKDAEGNVTATGGGSYRSPVNNIRDAKIRIRYYLGKYEETGQSRIEDWRVVEFVEGR